MKTVSFKTDMPGINCEKAARCTVVGKKFYTLLGVEDTRNEKLKVVVVADPSQLHKGGDDGKTDVPCTVRVRAEAGQFTVSEHKAESKK